MNKLSKVTATLLASSLALLLSTSAQAEGAGQLTLKVEPGFAVPLTNPQAQRFDAGGDLSVKGLVSLTPWLAVGPTVSVLALTSTINNVDTGTAWGAGAGVVLRRSHDNSSATLNGACSPWADVDFQAVKTGSLARTSLSAGVGLSFPTSQKRDVWVGPFLRFQDVFPMSSDPNMDTRDARVGILGMSMEFGGSHRLAKPTVSDRDHDGVPDTEDMCPDVPGPKENNGCPLPAAKIVPAPLPPPQAPVEKPFVLEIKQKIQFDFDSAVLHATSTAALDEIVKSLLAHTNYNVTVEGHASSEGQKEYNIKLSLRRANAVLEYLATHGVARDRLTALGFGSSVPVADNATETGRQANRRVEFEVTLVLTSKGDAK